ncbi:MAG: hypothetical protein MZW92_10095 [Comamonadaceae bacterium]|nr:hypothetical protein [Comamonadaceae bacterium]
MPVINFARLYAFRHGVAEVNTLDRLHALLEIGDLRGGPPRRSGQGLRLSHAAAAWPTRSRPSIEAKGRGTTSIRAA